MTRGFRLLPALGLVLAASGCATTPFITSAAPTATVAPSPTPVATPTSPAASKPAVIVIAADAITVLADDGSTLQVYDYFQPTGELVTGFSEFFGGEPTETPFGQSLETPAGVAHGWDGFTMYDDEWEPRPPVTPNHRVAVETDSVNGIRIRTEGGLHIGSSVAEVVATRPQSETDFEEDSGTVRTFTVDPLSLTGLPDSCPPDGCLVAVTLATAPGGDVIGRIISPTINFGN